MFYFQAEFVLIAEHRRPKAAKTEPHTYRTRAFIFVWSSFSAVNGSRARTYVRRRRRRRTTWRPYWSTYALHTSMQFDIADPFYGKLTAVRSRYPLTSTTWPYRGLRSELIEVTFLKLTDDQVMDFHWTAGSNVFFQIIRTSLRTSAPLLGMAKSIYHKWCSIGLFSAWYAGSYCINQSIFFNVIFK